ncbi:MAG: ribonuclease III domain-containing protein [Acutalibacteraceae bacterium]|nr:ribonuclease III domain-containing protein [Acutalibacteraceae bacterium]
MYYDKAKVKQLSPSVLSFVGDAVFGLLVRERLAEINRPSGELHSASVCFVSASGQVKAFEIIKDLLSEEEMTVFKRGRNFHTGRSPKGASSGDYHIATGVESLFGYLHLCGEFERLNELFSIIWEDFSATI